MSRPLTLTDLARMGCTCDEPTCDNRVLYLHGACHPSAGTWVSYTKGEDKVVIRCKECRRLVAEVAVAVAN